MKSFDIMGSEKKISKAVAEKLAQSGLSAANLKTIFTRSGVEVLSILVKDRVGRSKVGLDILASAL